jgi:hypothetical protein
MSRAQAKEGLRISKVVLPSVGIGKLVLKNRIRGLHRARGPATYGDRQFRLLGTGQYAGP